jgi:riboflavin synthase
MFTGIVETTGVVKNRVEEGSNLRFTIQSSIAGELKIDQSISHNGVCLTVVAQNEKEHVVEAVKETLQRSNLGALEVGREVNLERCVTLGSMMDGHLVQGHVDDVVSCSAIREESGSYVFSFSGIKRPELLVDKGSVCINGVSLTVIEPTMDGFSVAVIPYTFNHTTFKGLKVGDKANIEYDIIGKYLHRFLEVRQPRQRQ